MDREGYIIVYTGSRRGTYPYGEGSQDLFGTPRVLNTGTRLIRPSLLQEYNYSCLGSENSPLPTQVMELRTSDPRTSRSGRPTHPTSPIRSDVLLGDESVITRVRTLGLSHPSNPLRTNFGPQAPMSLTRYVTSDPPHCNPIC